MAKTGAVCEARPRQARHMGMAWIAMVSHALWVARIGMGRLGGECLWYHNGHPFRAA